jgi:murein tripeptide amidase MpaA
VNISQNFDAGNIEVVNCEDAGNIQLKIRADKASDFYQWFYFRLSGAKNTPCTMRIVNAGGAAYPPGFQNYRVCYSYDRQTWLRHPTSLYDGVMSIEFVPEYDSVYFAYFAPYSMERHADLVARSLLSPLCAHRVVGKTLDGQDLDLLRFSSDDAGAPKKNCWVIARQHPGESMAEWWMEGCIERLLDENNAETKKLLSQCNVYLMPNMNPDGSRRGHLRTNAAGRNLNREWANPEIDASPEVYFVKQAMQEIGVDFLLDVHGDESLPYCFIAGTEGLSNWDEQKQSQLGFYKNKLVELNADFQTERGYPAKTPGTANLTMSTAQTAQSHACLAMTLEMPFKDTTATPDETYGWSGERSKKLAHSCLDALSSYLESGLL